MGGTSSAISRDSRPEECVFCKIIHTGRSGSVPVTYQNDRLVAFEDARPAAALHLLIVPKAHICNTRTCLPGDVHLLQEMDDLARELLQKYRPGCRVKLGYHVPPWRSVDHLHLHAFALPHIPWWRSVKYCLPGVWHSSSRLIAQLQRQANAADGRAAAAATPPRVARPSALGAANGELPI